MQFTFYFLKEGERILVTSFKKENDEKKYIVIEEFQDFEVHEALNDKNYVISIIEKMVHHRTLKVHLNETESEFYLDGKIVNEEAETDVVIIEENIDENINSKELAFADMIKQFSKLLSSFNLNTNNIKHA